MSRRCPGTASSRVAGFPQASTELADARWSATAARSLSSASTIIPPLGGRPRPEGMPSVMVEATREKPRGAGQWRRRLEPTAGGQAGRMASPPASQTGALSYAVLVQINRSVTSGRCQPRGWVSRTKPKPTAMSRRSHPDPLIRLPRRTHYGGLARSEPLPPPRPASMRHRLKLPS